MTNTSKHHLRELNGSYTITHRLLPRHYEIQDLQIQGLNGKQISAATGLSYRQVMNLINSPNFQHELSLRRSKTEAQVDETILRQADAVQDVIKKQTLTAINKLTTLLDSPNDSVARQAANDILNRGGYPQVTKTDNTNKAAFYMDDATAKVLEQTLVEIKEPEPTTTKPEGEDT